MLEPIAEPVLGIRQIARDLTPTTISNGFIGFIFAATGPVAIILAVAQQGNLDKATIDSWIFGSFYVTGILTILACWLHRMPLAFFWTMPGAVLVGPALGHLPFDQVVGAYVATGVLMLILGLTGWVRRAMQSVPMPIVMGMVAGVFLKFGLDWILAVREDLFVAGSMTIAFVLLTAFPSVGKRLPALIGALLVGAIIVAVTGQFDMPESNGAKWWGAPTIYAPAFSWQAMIELVVPLAITVLVVQNGQGVAVLHAADHKAPVNFVTAACGLWSMMVAFVGAVPTCLTGPTNALISSSGPRESHYAAGIVVGVLAMVFGFFAPAATNIMLACPPPFIATIAGLAMIKVLGAAFHIGFGGGFQTGALVSFLVTVSGISIFNIGAPFWGLVFGFAFSLLMDRADFVKRSIKQ